MLSTEHVQNYGSDWWDEEAWTRRFHLSLRGRAPYHPNAAGMAAVADLIAAALQPPAA